MELHWLSPLDPGETDIARYSSRLVPRLAEVQPITGISDCISDKVPEWWRAPVNFTPAGGVDPLPVYHIGNHPAHLPIWRQSLLEPGLVVLHDISLVDLAKYVSHELGNPQLWKAMMLQQYGEHVRELVNRSEKSPEEHSKLVQAYPLFQPFLANAIGVVVHSNYARERVLQALPDGPPVLHLELPAPEPPPAPPRDYKTGKLDFIFCGHVGPNRRLAQFFEAWGAMDDRQHFGLTICGHVPNKRELLRYARHFGVEDYLEFRGYVTEDELEEAFRSAHFALNLRWPTMGETSGSQLRYWSAALPTLVTDVGWYSELPDDAVCKISPERELQDVRDLLGKILSDPDSYQEVGRRGREAVASRHSYEEYIRRLVEFAGSCLQRRLSYRTLDQFLVRTVASMCEDSSRTVLFRGAVEAAVSAFETADSRAG
jgi:glycosyltransferase involved in cell wall biosynthesis